MHLATAMKRRGRDGEGHGNVSSSHGWGTFKPGVYEKGDQERHESGWEVGTSKSIETIVKPVEKNAYWLRSA